MHYVREKVKEKLLEKGRTSSINHLTVLLTSWGRKKKYQKKVNFKESWEMGKFVFPKLYQTKRDGKIKWVRSFSIPKYLSLQPSTFN